MQLPQAFVTRTKALLGAEWPLFEQALHEEPPVSLRWNPAKASSPYPFVCEEAVPWASNAYYLATRPSFTFDPLFHAGCYYVQEASSMYLEPIIKKHISDPVRVLDLCAAPGGKSTQLASVLPEGSLLVANEVIRSRASVLAENIAKWGHPCSIVTHNDPEDFGRLNGFFDVLLADLPCSGEGMFRKDPVALKEWSVHHVRFCAERQKRIVADSWPALHPDGLLIYSTCTYNHEENEDNIAWICRNLGAEPVEEPRRFLPHKTKGEGFFIAALRKTGTQSANREWHFKAAKTGSDRLFADRKIHLLHPEQFAIFTEQNRSMAIPEIHATDYAYLKNCLKMISAGIVLGEQKGRDFIPATAFALSTALAMDTFPIWETDKASALRYLRKEALQDVPAALPKGYLLITYDRHPLGFVKNIGVRANNLYPSEWRIRSL